MYVLSEMKRLKRNEIYMSMSRVEISRALARTEQKGSRQSGGV